MEFLENTFLITDDPDVTLKNTKEVPSFDIAATNPTYEDLLCEAGEEVLHYLESFNLIQKPNFIILSSVRHYLYDSEELKRVKTLINLKAINEIKQVKHHTRSMNTVLPEKGYLAGCFMDFKNEKKRILKNYPLLVGLLIIWTTSLGTKVLPRIPVIGLFFSLFSDGRIKSWNTNEIYRLLGKSGFKVINMYEINGLTYFISQKVKNVGSQNMLLPKIISGFKKS